MKKVLDISANATVTPVLIDVLQALANGDGRYILRGKADGSVTVSQASRYEYIPTVVFPT
jgi:hypothetical protein